MLRHNQHSHSSRHQTRCLRSPTAKSDGKGSLMPEAKTQSQDSKQTDKAIEDLIKALNEDLAREYQAIIAYTVYSNVLKGAQWMNIAAELKKHAGEELQHALIIADPI